MTTAAHYTPATIIKLSGPLARLFGREHRYFLDRGTAEEAFSALRNTLDGFREAIAALERRGLVYAVFRNRQNVSADPEYLDLSRMVLRVAIQYELELRGLALSWHHMCAGNPEAAQQVRAEAAAAARAWADFCAGLGLQPAELILAVGGHHPVVIDLVRWAPAPEPALVEKWRGLFETAACGEMFGEARH
ncbi:hypothetical protein [Pseudomonas sp. JUb52]|uniref:hypothetical protein n=1 Tax=Pseudomonas sp. JUb52 TaxID=2485127 RepID=UPI0010D2E5F7|nr:hypothetical protein [Pseudomonas sp. JUb52]TCQ87850.1 hypothetical protein EC839_106127 [Pseudomonas sp. JUb52]